MAPAQNLIFIMLDSFRQDHVSIYNRGEVVFTGIPPCQTPNIDKFAKECIIFENVYPCGLPTMPVRYELMTGQFSLPFRSWMPLTSEDLSIAEILRREEYICGFITDTYHFRAPGMNYHRGFHSYQWVRGQEYDPWVSSPSRRDINSYVNEHYPPEWRARIEQFLANTDDFSDEKHWFPAQVMDRAIDWLKKNRQHKHIFLWIDSFEPHEPWDPPQGFDTYTDPNYKGPRLIMPMGNWANTWATPEQVQFIRGLYAGEAAFVDHCLGGLFEALRDLGYYEDSLIILTADHGHPLADHGKFLKGTDRMYSELLKVPFLVRLPGGKNAGRTKALAQFPDVLPTILELLGFGNNNIAMQGRSFVPVLKNKTEVHRPAVIAGYYRGFHRCIRDQNWSYVQTPPDEPDELYNLTDDPREQHNLIDEYPAEARRLAAQFGNIFRQEVPRIIKGVQGEYEMASAAVE